MFVTTPSFNSQKGLEVLGRAGRREGPPSTSSSRANLGPRKIGPSYSGAGTPSRPLDDGSRSMKIKETDGIKPYILLRAVAFGR